MFDVLLARIQQKYRTMKFPEGPPPALPSRFVGRPVITGGNCPPGCACCVDACPTGAIAQEDGLRLDLGRCLFCSECAMVCALKKISFTSNYRMATRSRDDLLICSSPFRPAQPLEVHLKRLFGRSLRLRQVSAGGCNACEADTNVLGTVGWDLGRFGIQFVASPRHADGLLITGPVPENMRLALLKTYEAVPAPKLVIAVGACAISGGPYAGHEEVHDGAGGLVPVDLFIPGCPPHPLTILDGLLRLMGRLETSVGEV
jgi:Ni,Fe-hydrogenase III small subunit/formate hydrogenlyase subunit 6/NADH:ubiquinone oxidoreductase subunit I